VIYFDTSYLVRLYVEDPGWDAVRALAATDDVASAVHGRTETVAAFHRILREGHVDVLRFGELLKQFQDDCAASGLHWLPLTDAALSRVETAYASLPATIFLRAADALHLACAAEHGFTEIHSNDARLLAAAPHFGIKGVNVIP